ncbi:MAG: alpha/beta hydrolase family esterase [Methylococcales bacterium]
MPVMFVLHGGGGLPGVVRYQTSMNDVADKYGFIFVYPAAISSVYIDRLLYWNSGPLRKDIRVRNVDDVGFISKVLTEVSTIFLTDEDRVYSTGLSNGAQMTFRLAAELSDRIAAIAPVSGDRTIGQFFAAPPQPVPVIYFHGILDTYLPFYGGLPAKSVSVFEAPVEDTMEGWIAQAGGDVNYAGISNTGYAVR